MIAPGAARDRFADDEARVVHGHGERARERLLEPGEARVGVHEHGVEVRLREAGGAFVVRALVGAAAHEDVAQAARGQRAGGAGGLQQRDQLAGELRAPEGEQLDQHRVGAHRAERREDPLLARLPRLLEREARVVGHEAALRAHAERRERDDLDAGRRRDLLGQRAAAHQHDPEALGQRRAQRVGAHQVAEPDRVLAVEEDRHAAASRRGSRWVSAAGRTRPTAGTAIRASTEAATCQSSPAGAAP